MPSSSSREEAAAPVELLTLEARGNVMLEVAKGMFRLSHTELRREILAALTKSKELLKSKGVAYHELKAALTPRPGRIECAFLFDSTAINNSWYGLPVFNAVFPILDARASHSVLAGDLLSARLWQNQLLAHLRETVVKVRPFRFQHSSQYYLIYINNLTYAMLRTMHQMLAQKPFYIGHLDLTYASQFKAVVSTILSVSFLKHGRVVILSHPDDVSEDTNENNIGYPFENYGCRIVSIPDALFGLFLSYKIERPVWPGFEVDTEFALAAVHEDPGDLGSLPIVVAEDKYRYLLREKSHALEGLGTVDEDPLELTLLIRRKLAANYVYNLRYRPDHNVSLFNLVLEVASEATGRYRAVASIEYSGRDKGVRLVTLF